MCFLSALSFIGGFQLFQKPQVCASAAEHILIMCSAETDSSSDHEARQSDKAVLLLNPTCSVLPDQHDDLSDVVDYKSA